VLNRIADYVRQHLCDPILVADDVAVSFHIELDRLVGPAHPQLVDHGAAALNRR
jgi:hypothetical protein